MHAGIRETVSDLRFKDSPKIHQKHIMKITNLQRNPYVFVREPMENQLFDFR